MNIGIISDTHKKLGRAKQIIDIFVDNKCDYIFHSGDIVMQEVLDYIKTTKIPYVAVLGNNDSHLLEHAIRYNLFQEPYFVKIGNTSFKIMHHPYYLFPEDSDITVYGHTHTQICEQGSKTLFLNSGESCARDRDYSQAMVLNIQEKKYTVYEYQRKIKTDKWEVVSKIFYKNKGNTYE